MLIGEESSSEIWALHRRRRSAYATPPAQPASSAASKEGKTIFVGKAKERSKKNLPFCGQPHHSSVSGTDCAVLQPGDFEQPRCSCILGTLHATWYCPLRFIRLFGYCPGFLPDGRHDPAQWNGDILSHAAKDVWAQLIELEAMPRTGRGPLPAPNFTHP
jgi:hypothetical protein